MRIHTIPLALLLVCLAGCCNFSDKAKVEESDLHFFGDSVLTIVSTNRPNGYNISLMLTDDLCLWRLKRGDSINRYLAVLNPPSQFASWKGDSIGRIHTTFDIPILRNDSLGDEPDCFFMDIDFDGEVEFVVKSLGYNRFYYACYDLVDGNRHEPCVGFLLPMDAPYNNLVSGYGNETRFDFENKTIYVYERSGLTSRETWSKPIDGKIRTYQMKDYNFYGPDGGDHEEHIETYKLIDDTLRLVSHEIEKY